MKTFFKPRAFTLAEIIIVTALIAIFSVIFVSINPKTLEKNSLHQNELAVVDMFQKARNYALSKRLVNDEVPVNHYILNITRTNIFITAIYTGGDKVASNNQNERFNEYTYTEGIWASKLPGTGVCGSRCLQVFFYSDANKICFTSGCTDTAATNGFLLHSKNNTYVTQVTIDRFNGSVSLQSL